MGEGLVREELFVRLCKKSAQRFKLRQVHIEIPQVEALEWLHVHFVEDQIFLDQAWAGESHRVCHDKG